MSVPLSFGDWLRLQPRRLCNFGIHSWEQSVEHWHFHRCRRCGVLSQKPACRTWSCDCADRGDRGEFDPEASR